LMGNARGTRKYRKSPGRKTSAESINTVPETVIEASVRERRGKNPHGEGA